MSNRIVVGLQWGDEGKGKIVDFLSQKTDIVARYQGGANAGHTVYVKGKKFVLHLIPSGILHPKKLCLIGSGVVLEPEELKKEIEMLAAQGVKVEGRLKISAGAHIVLPFHRELDLWEEAHRGEKIGTTGRGIGPAYSEKYARRGIRAIDLLSPEKLSKKVADILSCRNHGGELSKLDPINLVQQLRSYEKFISPYLVDGSRFLNEAIKKRKSVLFEGAQGSLLDVDFGTYPYATPSHTIAGGALTGTGVGPRSIDEVIGVMKAYTTRVGNGPFPTELTGVEGELLRKTGSEFGATTGRPRRTGWLDLVILKHACRINGADKLAIMKLDVLDSFPEIKICTAYEYKGKKTEELPLDLCELAECKPVYKTYPGWKSSTRGITRFAKLPVNARKYLAAIEKALGVPISLISTGPEREATIVKK